MSLDFTDDQSTLVQVMAWCRQATSHYLSQCWPRSLSPYGVTRPRVNTLKPRQNGHHFPGDIFKCIFLNENVWIWILLSLKFVSKGPINNIPALVQIMAWHLPSDNPLSEPMLVILLMHICVTWPQWVNRHWGNHIFDIKQGLTQTVAQVCLDACQVHIITQTPVSSSCCLPLGALQSMGATWCKI